MNKLFFAAMIAASAFTTSCQNSSHSGNLKTDIDTLSYALGMSFSIPEENLKMGLVQMGSDSAYTREFQQGFEDGLNLVDDKKSIAYNIGLQQGMMVSQREIKGIEQQVFGDDSVSKINMDLFIAGLKNASEKKGILLTDSTGNALTPEAINSLIRTAMQNAYTKRQNEKYGEYKQKNSDFMADIAKKEGMQALGNGVYYKELTPSKGEKAAKGETLELTYEGRLIDGTVFDKTEEGKTAKFPVGVGRAIPGFDAALQNIPVGAEWEVYIPAEEAYKDMESGKIKPFSALIFKIKAVKVVKD